MSFCRSRTSQIDSGSGAVWCQTLTAKISESRRGRLAAVPKAVEPAEPEEAEASEEEEDLESFDEDEETGVDEDDDV